jgi:superfamily I DNA/RNA helicase
MVSTLFLNDSQRQIAEAPLNSHLFLSGPAGSGKTTSGIARIKFLIEQSVDPGAILVITPQRTLFQPYQEAVFSPEFPPGSMVTLLTINGLAKRMVNLFWPLVSEAAGFRQRDIAPTFLTLETAQYYMARIVNPLLDQGFFNSISLEPNRLFSQILDNLNKAAVVGFPYTEIGERLKAAWIGEPSQTRVYEDAQECATQFRRYCLDHNLLDFSLQLDVFWRYIWFQPLCKNYLISTYQHLLVDNIEEDTPIAHDLLKEWLPSSQSALIIFDEDAGFRSFLGADSEHAFSLKNFCEHHIKFSQTILSSHEVQVISDLLGHELLPEKEIISTLPNIEWDNAKILDCIKFKSERFFPDMLDWITNQIDALVHIQKVPPSEIAVLSPFLSDSLRFSLAARLQEREIPTRSHRPSRALSDEPVILCLLTLTLLAHPQWLEKSNIISKPSEFDFAYALLQSIDGLDLVRAQILSKAVYPRLGMDLGSFDHLNHEMKQRITYRFGELYERIRIWLVDYSQQTPDELDHFISRLFGELLSQPGLGFHAGHMAGEITANLIESIQKFRWAAAENLIDSNRPFGVEYLEMVRSGVIAAQYLRSWHVQPTDAVLLAPAYTFLMNNHLVDYQFWLDTGSRGWSDRLYQPLTHPYVLSRHWSKGQIWSDADEVEYSRQSLFCLITGLLRRCRRGIFLGLSELNELGYEQRGPLLLAFQRLLRRLQNMN